MIPIEDNTPLAMLTVGQLRQVMSECLPNNKGRFVPVVEKYVYGIPGIMRLFSVSRPVAQEYKDTFLQPAVKQNGRKIVVDAEIAMQLFAERQGGRKSKTA